MTISGWDYSDYDDDDGGEDDDYDYDDDDDDYDYDIVEESVLSERESGEKKKKPKCPRIKAGKLMLFDRSDPSQKW